jgi:hypothetical protein
VNVEPAHTGEFGPAFAIGAGMIFRVICEETGPHGALPLTVNVKTIVPVCAGVGVYVGFKVVAFVSIPGPGAVHRMELLY